MSDARRPPSDAPPSSRGGDPAKGAGARTELDAAAREALAEADAALVLDINDLERREDPYAPLEIELPVAYVERALGETDATANGSGHARFQVSVQKDGTVLIQGGLAARLRVPCARCLEDADVDGGAEIVATFVPAERVRGLLAAAGVTDEEDIELESEELEEFPYQGRSIDLRKVIDEQLALAYPIRALCERGEACAGLCSSCGQNLNARPPRDGDCANCGEPVAPSPGGDGDEAEEPAWKAKLRLLKDD